MSLTALILVFASLIAVGVISVFVAMRKIAAQKEYVSTFVEHAISLLDESTQHQDKSEQKNYVLANYQEVSYTVGEELYKKPMYEIGSCISYQNPLDSRLSAQIVAEQIEYNGEVERKKKALKAQLCNPFTLLYRGVECIMDFVFGYIIRKFNPHFNPANSKVWQIISTLVALAGSIASILSFFLNK